MLTYLNRIEGRDFRDWADLVCQRLNMETAFEEFDFSVPSREAFEILTLAMHDR